MTDRALHVVQAVCSDGFAGVERHVAGLARTLARRGHTVTVLGGDHVRMPIEIGGDEGLMWHPADTIGAAIRGLARSGSVDIVHAHMTEAETAATLAWPRHRAHIVATRHFARARGSSPSARVAAAVLRRVVSTQVAVSEYVARSVDGPSRVVRTGIVGPTITVPVAARTRTVLVVSRLEAEKRVEVALDVWQRSTLRHAGWRLMIAGDGALRGDLETAARRQGIADTCEFLGARDDIPDLLDCAGIVLATCPIEAFGLAVVEAMAHAVPVVATAGGAHSEILGLTPNARLFDPDDPAMGARLLDDLAADAGERARYAADLRRVQSTDLTAERQGEQIERIYRDVLG